MYKLLGVCCVALVVGIMMIPVLGGIALNACGGIGVIILGLVGLGLIIKG